MYQKRDGKTNTPISLGAKPYEASAERGRYKVFKTFLDSTLLSIILLIAPMEMIATPAINGTLICTPVKTLAVAVPAEPDVIFSAATQRKTCPRTLVGAYSDRAANVDAEKGAFSAPAIQ